jgi:hypothetical protein
MCMRFLNETGKVRHRITIRHLTPAELLSEENRKSRDKFDAAIAETRGPVFTKMDFPMKIPLISSRTKMRTHSGDSPVMPDTDEYDRDGYNH